MKSVAFTIAILVGAVGFAKGKAKQSAKPKAKAKARVVAVADTKVKLKKEPIRLKVETIKKSHSDLSGAISEGYQGRKEIQKEVQSAAGIEKVVFEPSREAYRVEIPSTTVSSASDDAVEPKFVAPPRRGPASDTKSLLNEVDESEKAD